MNNSIIKKSNEKENYHKKTNKNEKTLRKKQKSLIFNK